MESIEKEAEEIIKDAERKAEEIIEEAKKRAEEVLNDENYLHELESLRKELERKLEDEINKIIDNAKVEANNIRKIYSEKLESIAKHIASIVTGVDIV